MQKRKRIIRIVVGIIVVIIGIIGGSTYMSHKAARERNDELIKHAFRLLEEQIATYIKENYSGVSKIEFSPIFYGGGNGSMVTINVVPVIYDNEGNRSLISQSVNGAYGLYEGISALSIDGDGNDIIYLEDMDNNKEFNVSSSKVLPEEAKLKSHLSIDYNMEQLKKENKLSGIQKSNTGSPDAKIVYNLEIREGDYSEWR